MPHHKNVWDGDAERCFPIDGASETAGDAPKLLQEINTNNQQ